MEAGARFLHVVDLDGAREGEPANLHHVERIAAELPVPLEYGGGLRSIASIRRALAAGADRVVLGTAAFTDPELLDEALSAFTSRILVGVDVRGGAGVGGGLDARDPGARRGRHPAHAAAWRHALRLHQRRP